MSKFIDYLKENKLFVGISVATLIILSFMITYSIKNTYSVSDKYVVFQGIDSYKDKIIKSCKINANGKISSDCVNEAKQVCSSWTYDYSGSNYVDLSGTFSDNTTVYCAGDTSSPTGYTWGCYVCPDDPTVMKWLIYGGGYAMPDIGRQDENCPGKLLVKDESITDDKQCKYTPPEQTYACYECKNDKTIVDWLTNGDADSRCSSGYRELAGITRAQCKYVAPEPTDACYECKSDKNIMEWRNSATGDNKCPGGYNKTTKTKAQCTIEIPENPPTGQTKAIIAWIIASISIGCSIWYFKKSI